MHERGGGAYEIHTTPTSCSLVRLRTAETHHGDINTNTGINMNKVLSNLISEVFMQTGEASLDQQVKHPQHQLESLREWGWELDFQGGTGGAGGAY